MVKRLFRKQSEPNDTLLTNWQMTGSLFSGKNKTEVTGLKGAKHSWGQEYHTETGGVGESFHHEYGISNLISHPSPKMLAPVIMPSKQEAGRNFSEESDFINQPTRKGLKMLTSEFLSPNPKMAQKNHFDNAYLHIQRFYLAFYLPTQISVDIWEKSLMGEGDQRKQSK